MTQQQSKTYGRSRALAFFGFRIILVLGRLPPLRIPVVYPLVPSWGEEWETTLALEERLWDSKEKGLGQAWICASQLGDFFPPHV